MIKQSFKQTGSAHAVIIVILVLALLGALGFIFWQNFIDKKDEPATKDQEHAKSDSQKDTVKKTKTHQGGGYKLNYPVDDWSVVEVTYDGMAYETTIQTKDYKPMGASIEEGALIGIYKTDVGQQTIDERIGNARTFPGTKDIKKTTINGIPAFTYNSTYEGLRYHTVIVANDTLTYDIVYRLKDGKNPSLYMDDYKLITSSFKLIQ